VPQELPEPGLPPAQVWERVWLGALRLALAQAVGLALLRAWAPELPRAPWGQTGCAASQTLPVLQPGLRRAVARARVPGRAK